MEKITKRLKSTLFISSLLLGITTIGVVPQTNADVLSFLDIPYWHHHHHHHHHHKESAEKLGLRLETKFWKDVEHDHSKRLSKLVSSSFQGTDLTLGIIDKDEFLTQLATIKISDFTFTNFVVTKKNDQLIVTYDLSVVGNISKSTNVSIYVHSHNGWKMVSHSYVN